MKSMEERITLTRAGITLVSRVRRCESTTPSLPIIFLHGLASNMSRWAELTRTTSLATRHTLVRTDLRGHGESLTRTAFTRDDWCDDVLAITDAMGASQFIVVGHSLGAQVAATLAARAPTRVCAAALIDPIFVPALVPARKAMLARIPWYSRAGQLIRLANRLGVYRRHLPPLDLEAMDRDARRALASPDPQALAAFVKQYSSTRADLRHIPHANYIADMVELFRPLPALSAIECPVLLMRSSKADFHDASAVDALLTSIARLETVTIDCHHWPVTEKPDVVRAHLERWVSRIAA
jgi:esterase